MHFSSIWPIDRTLSGATTPGQSGPGSDGNEGVLRIPQNFSITGTSPSDCLVLYPGHSLVGSYPSAEVQSVYSTAPADLEKSFVVKMTEVPSTKKLPLNFFWSTATWTMSHVAHLIMSHVSCGPPDDESCLMGSTWWSYLPTPPLGQDMTQGQFFLSRVQQVWIQSFPSPRLVASPRLKNQVYLAIYP